MFAPASWQAGNGYRRRNNVKPLTKTLASAAIGTGLLAASAVSASAAPMLSLTVAR